MSKVITVQPGQVVHREFGNGVVYELVYLGDGKFEWREAKR